MSSCLTDRLCQTVCIRNIYNIKCIFHQLSISNSLYLTVRNLSPLLRDVTINSYHYYNQIIIYPMIEVLQTDTRKKFS
jgi:hypothetical protein